MKDLLTYGGAAGVACIFAALALWPVFLVFLNPRFDPDWKDRRWSAFEGEALPFFAVFRMVLYVPAVASRYCARRLFGFEEGDKYDFRGRAGRLLHALCLAEMILAGSGLSLILITHWTLKPMD